MKISEIIKKNLCAVSTDGTTELDSVNTDNVLEPDSELSKVNDEPAVRQNSIVSKYQPKSRDKNLKPCNDVKAAHGCDNIDMIVPTSSNRKAKKYCCVYCHNRYSKLVTHLLFVHKNEADVKKIQDSPPGKISFYILVTATAFNVQ